MHRIIFTGAQGTGKTTVLNHYKENGKNVITEVVRRLAKKGVKIFVPLIARFQSRSECHRQSIEK